MGGDEYGTFNPVGGVGDMSTPPVGGGSGSQFDGWSDPVPTSDNDDMDFQVNGGSGFESTESGTGFQFNGGPEQASGYQGDFGQSYNMGGQVYENGVPERPRKQFALSHKVVGIIVLVIGVVLFGFFMLLDSIKVKPRSQSSNSTQVSSQSSSSNTQTPSAGGIQLKQVGDDIEVDYTGPVLEAQGVVTSKSRLLQGKQLLYCLDITMSASIIVHYYCSYNVWGSVAENDVLTIKYQQVSETCFHIVEITK